MLRLLNRCVGIKDREPLRFNGEVSNLQFLQAAVEAFQNVGGTTHEDLERDDNFLSHYHRGQALDAISRLGDAWRHWCGGTTLWGFKEVNYGIRDYALFESFLKALKTVWPSVRFVILTRDLNDCVDSMQRAGWWKLSTSEMMERVTTQRDNFQKASNTFASTFYQIHYNDLLEYSKFSEALSQIGLRIERKDYDRIINKKIIGA